MVLLKNIDCCDTFVEKTHVGSCAVTAEKDNRLAHRFKNKENGGVKAIRFHLRYLLVLK